MHGSWPQSFYRICLPISALCFAWLFFAAWKGPLQLATPRSRARAKRGSAEYRLVFHLILHISCRV